MKVIAMRGDEKRCRKTATAIVKELQRRRYSVALWQAEVQEHPLPNFAGKTIINNAESSVLHFGKALNLETLLPYLQEEIFIIDHPYAGMPNITIEAEPDDFTVLSFDGEDFAADFASKIDILLQKTPELLPFPLGNPCCIACDWKSCEGLMRAILAGEADISACQVKKPTVIVEVGGFSIPMVEFVQKIIRAANLGILNTLNAFQEGQEVVIRIKE